MKGLLAVAPNGVIIFVSELLMGSISDRQLTIQSGIVEMYLQINRLWQTSVLTFKTYW